MMQQNQPLIVTISRQLGSGGAYLGQQLASRLGILYVDREIIQQAAQQLDVDENVLQERDENVASFWQSVVHSFSFGSLESSYVPPILSVIPTDSELIAAESAAITELAQQRDAVIVGRSGSYVLRNHPRHIAVFLHAKQHFRVNRLQVLYQMSEQDAIKAINASDQARARFHHALSGNDWNDARQYHLCLDTGALGFSTALEVIINYINNRFSDIHMRV